MSDLTTAPCILADRLRSAAAWLELAADALDRGDVEQAARTAELGVFGAPQSWRIRPLERVEHPADDAEKAGGEAV